MSPSAYDPIQGVTAEYGDQLFHRQMFDGTNSLDISEHFGAHNDIHAVGSSNGDLDVTASEVNPDDVADAIEKHGQWGFRSPSPVTSSDFDRFFGSPTPQAAVPDVAADVKASDQHTAAAREANVNEVNEINVVTMADGLSDVSSELSDVPEDCDLLDKDRNLDIDKDEDVADDLSDLSSDLSDPPEDLDLSHPPEDLDLSDEDDDMDVDDTDSAEDSDYSEESKTVIKPDPNDPHFHSTIWGPVYKPTAAEYDGPQYEIERITKHEFGIWTERGNDGSVKYGRALYYLVKYKGQRKKEWETSDPIPIEMGCAVPLPMDKINEYYRKHPRAVRPAGY